MSTAYISVGLSNPEANPTPSTETKSSSSSSTAQFSSTKAGLDTGAKVGIGVGVPIGVIALLLLGVFLWRFRSRLRINNIWTRRRDIAEMDSAAEVRKVELPTRANTAELPGSMLDISPIGSPG